MDNEISDIFTLERKGQLDRDISVVTAVSVDYLNNLLNDIIQARNEASALYQHIGQNNYDLSVDGMLNLPETVRQLYDNQASIKRYMLDSDSKLQAQLNKLNYYMYDSSENNISGFNLIGKVRRLESDSQELRDLVQTKQYEFNIKSDVISSITYTQSNGDQTSYQLSNVLMTFENDPVYLQEIIVAGQGEIFYDEIGDRDHVGSSIKLYGSTTFWIPIANSGLAGRRYTICSKDHYKKTLIVIKHNINSVETVNIGEEPDLSTGSLSSKIYSVETYCNDYSFGKVVGGGKYYGGQTIRLSAIPYQNYVFSKWNDGDVNPVKEITLTGHVICGAEFKESSDKTCIVQFNGGLSSDERVIYVQSDDLSCLQFQEYKTEYGNIRTSCEVPVNTQLVLKCVPAPHTAFVQWNYAGPTLYWNYSLSSVNPTQLYAITENCSFQAQCTHKYIWKTDVSLYDEFAVQTWKRQMMEKGYTIRYDMIEHDQISSMGFPKSITDIAIIHRNALNSYQCLYAVNNNKLSA